MVIWYIVKGIIFFFIVLWRLFQFIFWGSYKLLWRSIRRSAYYEERVLLSVCLILNFLLDTTFIPFLLMFNTIHTGVIIPSPASWFFLCFVTIIPACTCIVKSYESVDDEKKNLNEFTGKLSWRAGNEIRRVQSRIDESDPDYEKGMKELNAYLKKDHFNAKLKKSKIPKGRILPENKDPKKIR